MIDAEPRRLLDDALGHLRRYRSLLLESRSGAASEKEQQALALHKLIRDIERSLAASERPASAT